MDARITKKRLSYLLSYDWVKMVLAVVAAIIVWSLVFTMTATRITNTQRFVVMNYTGTKISADAKMYKGNSYEVIEAELVDNLRGGEDYFWEIFQANIGVGEGDLLMVANYPSSRTAKTDESGNEVKDENDNVVYEYGETYLEDALSSMVGKFTRLDDGDEAGYFTQMKNYLAKFYTVTSEQQKTFSDITLTVASFDESSLNTQLVKDEFRARIKANKDKRFKKEAQILAGEQDEIKRIQSYLTAYNTFFTYLEQGVVTLTYVDVALTETFSVTGVYGINLCPNEQTMGGLKEQFYYTDFENTTTAKDMNVMFMSLEDLDADFQYENILYLNALIQDVYKPL